MTPFRVALISAIVGALLGVVGLHIYQVNVSPDVRNLTVTYAPAVHSLVGVRMCSVDQFGDGTATGSYSVGNYKGTIKVRVVFTANGEVVESGTTYTDTTDPNSQSDWSVIGPNYLATPIPTGCTVTAVRLP